MSHAQPTTPKFQPAFLQTPDQIQAAKRLEKLQSHSASHRTAGTHEAPKQPASGVLRQLQTDRAHD